MIRHAKMMLILWLGTSLVLAANRGSRRLLANESMPDPRNFGTWKPGIGECGQPLVRPRKMPYHILGGVPSGRGQFPFAVLLEYFKQNTTMFSCGGSLLNKLYVLTAAHCHVPGDEVRFVVLGEYDLTSDPDCDDRGCSTAAIRVPVQKVIRHPDYDLNGALPRLHDIALIRLEWPVTLYQDHLPALSFVSPICLPWNEEVHLTEDDQLHVIGWGYVSNDEVNNVNKSMSGAGFNVLQMAMLNMVERDKCLATYFLDDLPFFFCAGDMEGVDSCNGDSGGPLLFRTERLGPFVQVGVISIGPAVCGLPVPGLYTNVSAYMRWIEDTLEP